ncbi:MAG: DUF2934 domain-containing protein [Candidatus Methylacidiphilales bacterium]|nr:DUF2934 domain-containing protein [Candidatus Methylacidiphilales bacterium]
MPTKAKASSVPLSDDAIRHRAYLLWEADGRPDGQAEHYWMKASEPAPDVAAKPKAKATAKKTAEALKSARPRGKAVSPAEPAPLKLVAKAKATPPAKVPKVKAAAAKVSAPAVKAKPAAKAPAKKPAAKKPKA